MTEKVIGYSILAVGLVIILLSLLSGYGILTKRQTPAKIFNFEGVSLPLGQMLSQSIPTEARGALDTKKLEEQKAELVSAQVLNDTSNLIAHLFILGFFVSAGAKIATIGTSLVRPIVVKDKGKII